MTAPWTAIAALATILVLSAAASSDALAGGKHRHGDRAYHAYGPYAGYAYAPRHHRHHHKPRHRGHGKHHAHAHPAQRFGHRHGGHGHPRGYALVAPTCHSVVRIGRHHGRPAKFRGTLCYDALGRPYIVPGSRHVIAYLGY